MVSTLLVRKRIREMKNNETSRRQKNIDKAAAKSLENSQINRNKITRKIAWVSQKKKHVNVEELI